jgi:repressor LexA
VIGPSKRQGELLAFMAAYAEREGMPPTLKEMVEFLGARSTTAAHDMLKQLDKKGYVMRKPRASRGTRLTRKAHAFVAAQLSEGDRGQLG